MDKWYNVYPQLATQLYKFYSTYKSDAGNILLKKISSKTKTLKYFDWLVNQKSIYKNSGIDPIHIYSSFNRHRQTGIMRTAILNLWFEILDTTIKYNEINYEGCPAPFSLKISSARDPETRSEIWELFSNIIEKNQLGLNQNTFSGLKKWYGIDVVSLSIFLFWIEPKNFLSLDKNNEKLLLKAGIIDSPPRKYEDYKRLLIRKNALLYIEIAKGAYDLMYKNTKSNSFIEKLRRIYRTERLQTGSNFSFKIIALRPLKGMGKDHLKALDLNTFYCFYNDFDFKNANKIKYEPQSELNLYDTESLQVNLSAIVGKNGSGKSALSELLFIAINNIAFYLRKSNKIDLLHVENVNMELYFHIGTLYKIVLFGKIIKVIEFEYNDGYYQNEKTSSFGLEDLFYTIAVNYSHYSLNSRELGKWIEKLFHKNDAYQTPLVINPYRLDGNININSENDLVKVRLLANLLEPIDPNDKENLRVITDNKRSAQRLHFKMHNEKIERLNNQSLNFSTEIMHAFVNYFNLSTTSVPNDLIVVIKRYLSSKLHKICINYEPYNIYLENNNTQLNLKDINALFEKIEDDPSHITYKIKQVINFFRHKTYKWFPLDKKVRIDELSRYIEDVKSKNARDNPLRTIELMPPSFFDFDIFLNDQSNFNKLSSGEKQKIYTVSSIIYHLNNLDSVSTSNDLITYQFVNIIFDEVELYFHPEMQRTFVHYLLDYLKRARLDNILALNFCFITHSPFILSDIPSNNILFLDEDGKPNKLLNNSKTFGGNIHDLLANSFFLNNDGYMGEFANRKINEVITNLENSGSLKDNFKIGISSWDEDKLLNFINTIGEPLIMESLKEIYINKTGSYEKGIYSIDSIEEIDKQIKHLEQLKSKIK